MGLSKAHPQHLINMALFTLNFFKTDDKRNTVAQTLSTFVRVYKVTSVIWKDVIMGKCQSLAPLLTIGRGFLQLIWIPAWLTRPWTAETSN